MISKSGQFISSARMLAQLAESRSIPPPRPASLPIFEVGRNYFGEFSSALPLAHVFDSRAGKHEMARIFNGAGDDHSVTRAG